MKNISEHIPGFLVKRCPKSGRIVKIRFDNIYAKLLFPFVGILAIVWFLIRVIPKPSRITYPCQQVAAGIGGSFLFYLIGTFTSLSIYTQIRKRMSKAVAWVFIVSAAMIISVTWVVANSQKIINPEDSFILCSTHPEGANEPIGIGKGLFPGRVV